MGEICRSTWCIFTIRRGMCWSFANIRIGRRGEFRPIPLFAKRLSMRWRADLFIYVGAGLIISKQMLSEVFPGALGGVGGVFAECVTRAGEIDHIKAFVGLDEGIDQAKGVGGVNVVIGFAVNQEEM